MQRKHSEEGLLVRRGEELSNCQCTVLPIDVLSGHGGKDSNGMILFSDHGEYFVFDRFKAPKESPPGLCEEKKRKLHKAVGLKSNARYC